MNEQDNPIPKKVIRTLAELESVGSHTYNPITGDYEPNLHFAEAETDFMNHVTKLQNVSAVYSKADTVITGEQVLVKVDSSGEMVGIAHNDGKEITFNASLVENINDTTITSLHGFNYHEVAHVLFSPRAGSQLGKWIEESRVRRAYNVLEDSRIERLLIAKYPSTRLFLEACVIDYLLKGDSSQWGDYFHLVTGRKYVDIEVRQLIADKFIAKFGVDIAKDIHAIIHEYRELALPTQSDRAKELILKMSKYMGLDNQEPQMPTPPNAHTNRPVGNKGRPDSGAEQKKLQERGEQMERGSGQEQLADKQEGVEREGDIENGENHNPTEQDKELRDKMNKRHDNLIKSEQVKGGTAEIRNAIDYNPDSGSSIRQCHYVEHAVNKRGLDIAFRFSNELERLRIENDPMWQLEQPTGRLNVGRSIHADINDIDRLFDKWDIGNDNRDIEAIIALDNSGSMSWHMNQALMATWIIKRALEAIDSKVTVFRFNNDGRLLYSSQDKASTNAFRSIGSSGGTNPIEVLLESERIFNESDRPVKLLITLSDGGWDNSNRCDEVMSRIGLIEGALTVSVLLGNYSSYQKQYGDAYLEEMLEGYRHNAHLFHAISEPEDLVSVASKIVTATLQDTR